LIEFGWERACWVAELAGKRLPEEREYELAATNEGTTRFPWGEDWPEDEADWWKWQPVGAWHQDALRQHPEVRGLFSNVAEWMATPGVFYPGSLFPHDEKARFLAVVRGRFFAAVVAIPVSDDEAKLGARTRYMDPHDSPAKTIGMRFARSAKPRLKVTDFGGAAARPPPQ
jgi:formylglycine-generating enzyme required for sulfatase activity